MTTLLNSIISTIARWRLAAWRKRRVCAWCLGERGEVAKPGQSHGICTRHYNRMLDEMKQGEAV